MEKNISKFFQADATNSRFSKIKITLASPEKIKSWSFGEIKKTRNYQLQNFQT